MKPFIVRLDNPYSFLWTFGIFLCLNLTFNLFKKEEIYLVPLESHFLPYIPFLVLNKSDWLAFNVENKLNKQQRQGVLILSLPTKDEESPKDWESYSLPEKEKENIKKDLQLESEEEALNLRMVQTCRKGSSYSFHYFVAFLKSQHPSVGFGKPLLDELVLVERQDLKEEAFFRCGEVHPVEIDGDQNHYLKKCAGFMKLRCRDFSPVLAPLRGSISPNSFLYFPSDERSDFNDYFIKLSQREKGYCVAYVVESLSEEP